MRSFPTKEERLEKRDVLIAEASAIMETVDSDAVNRMTERRYGGIVENDNKLLQHADRAHTERELEAMELLLKAYKYTE